MLKKIDEIYVKIRCASEECDLIRENGIFFSQIAEALFLDIEDVKEVLITDGKVKVIEHYLSQKEVAEIGRIRNKII